MSNMNRKFVKRAMNELAQEALKDIVSKDGFMPIVGAASPVGGVEMMDGKSFNFSICWFVVVDPDETISPEDAADRLHMTLGEAIQTTYDVTSNGRTYEGSMRKGGLQ